MLPIQSFFSSQPIKAILTDIDDTLTTDGKLLADTYQALERLRRSGLLVVPVTGRPAGWCDHIARLWPVDAIVGENGAFYFRYLENERKFIKRYLHDDATRRENRHRLDSLQKEILRQVPGSALASDQAYREADLAIDYREDIEPLSPLAIERIVALFEEAGATAKISSIHVNGWFGIYDKLTMTRTLFRECFNLDLDSNNGEILFIGDSPNDAPMFSFFQNSVGVANVNDFETLAANPKFVTDTRGGSGFAEMTNIILRNL